MKKSTIWILAAIMAITFFSLLYLQITYLSESIGFRRELFKDKVNRSLSKVSRDLEVDQTKKYLNEGFIGLRKSKRQLITDL